MSAIIIASLPLLAVLIYRLALSAVKQINNKRMNRMFGGLSELGSKYSLSFSGHTLLKKNLVGIDGLHRKLLVVNESDKGREDLIDLHEVRSCSIKKLYGPIRVGDLKRRRLNEYLDKMLLCFEFYSQRPPVELCFYDRREDAPGSAGELEQKARKWEMMLSKMIGRKTA